MFLGRRVLNGKTICVNLRNLWTSIPVKRRLPIKLQKLPFCIIIHFMSKFEKLKNRFLAKPKDFTYDELKTLLNKLGYYEVTLGKSSGSRVAFINEISKNVIRLHKPHPGNILKRYQLDLIEDELRAEEILK